MTISCRLHLAGPNAGGDVCAEPYCTLLQRFQKGESTYNVVVTFLTPEKVSSDLETGAAPSSDGLSEITATFAASILASLTVDEITTFLTDSVDGVPKEVQAADVEPRPSVAATIPLLKSL